MECSQQESCGVFHSGVQVNLREVHSARRLWRFSLWSTGTFERSALSKSLVQFFALEYRQIRVECTQQESCGVFHSGVQVVLNGVLSARVLWSLSLLSTGEFEWSAHNKSPVDFFTLEYR
jgi:hypothetical protein